MKYRNYTRQITQILKESRKINLNLLDLLESKFKTAVDLNSEPEQHLLRNLFVTLYEEMRLYNEEIVSLKSEFEGKIALILDEEKNSNVN